MIHELDNFVVLAEASCMSANKDAWLIPRDRNIDILVCSKMSAPEAYMDTKNWKNIYCLHGV